MIHRGDNFRVQVPGAGMKSSVPVSPPKITRNLQLPTMDIIIWPLLPCWYILCRFSIGIFLCMNGVFALLAKPTYKFVEV